MRDLEEIADGLFVSDMTRQIRVSPDELAIGRFFVPATLQHAEHEEVAARLIARAQEHGMWVGLAYSKLQQELIDEARIEKARYERRYGSPIQRLKRSIVFVLAVMRGRSERAELPVSVLRHLLLYRQPGGFDRLGFELSTMQQKGFIGILYRVPTDILMPTPLLAQTILEAQRESAAVQTLV